MMAKKRTTARPRKGRKKQKVSFESWLKRLILSAIGVVLGSIGSLFLYSYFYPAGQKSDRNDKQFEVSSSFPKRKTESKKDETPKKKSSPSTEKKPSSSVTLKFPPNAELPRLTVKRQEQVIRHEGYTVSYNSDYRIANWVAYELTGKEAKSSHAERSNKFVPDPDVTGATATNEDYTRTGYDRGHLAPAGDMRWSAKAMRESFYLSNICPQKPGLNRGIWKELEELSRLWAKEAGSLLIVTGPVIEKDMKRLGKNRVGVPKTFYKVICTIVNNEYQGIGFLFDNRDYGGTSLKSMAVPIDKVEKVTGIDFFPSLPDDVEKRMESSVDSSVWSF